MSGIGKVVRFSDEVPDKRPWQDGLTTSSKALSFLLSTGMLSDITFAVGPDGKQFRVHRLILATRSQMFEEMLVSDPRYCSSDDVIGAREDSVAGFTWLMQHIYCDKTEIDSLELALQILQLSEKYLVAGAYDCCLKYLRTSVRRNNVLHLYKFLLSSNNDNDSLYSLCRKIFRENGNSVLTSPALLKMSARSLKSLLNEPLTVSSEVVIFNAVLSWAKAQLKPKGLNNTASNLRKEVEPFLSSIRFFTMTSEEFVQNVLITDVLTSDETVLALKQIAKPSSVEDIKGFKLSPSREPRAQLITKDRTRSCSCDGVTRTWLKRANFEFHFTTSDNIVLLGFKLAMNAASTPVQLEISKEDSPKVPLGSAQLASNGSLQSMTATFLSPPHLRESVGYLVRIFGSQDGSGLEILGAEHNAATFSDSGITFTLAPGVFIQAILFI